MPTRVIDYSWARPSPSSIRTSGYSGVIRYLSFEPSKNLSAGERDALWAEGLAIGLVWEAEADAPLQGYGRGQSDAREANRQADALGWPGHVVIVYAVDFGASSSQFQAIRDYFRGVKSVGGRPAGVYGADHVCDDLGAHEPVHCYWQCAAWSGSGSGTGGAIYVPEYGHNVQLSNKACLFQYYGSNPIPDTDHNESTPHEQHVLSDLLYHPSGPGPSPEEDYSMKCVYTPEFTGGVGWRAVEVRGRRFREGYPDQLDLEVDMASGLVDGSVELKGDQAWRFLEMYPERGYEDVQLITCAPDTTWALEVAKLPPGVGGRFFLNPNQYLVRIHDDAQWDGNRFVGVPDKGELAESFLYNQPLVEWGAVPVNVDMGDVVLDGAVVGLTPEALAEVAQAVNDEAHARSAE